MSRNAQDLKHTDLPGVDAETFAEWKRTNSRAAKAPLLGLLAWAIALITVPTIGGAVGWLIPIVLWFIYMFAYAVPLASRERKLASSIGVPAALGLHPDYAAHAERRARLTKWGLAGVAAFLGVVSLLLTLSVRRDNTHKEATRAVSLKALARTYPVSIEGSAQTYPGAEVKPGFFDSARVFPSIGVFFSDISGGSDSTGLVVLSYDIWEELFKGDPRVLAQRVTLNGRPFVVTAVAPRGFREPNNAALWTQDTNSR